MANLQAVINPPVQEVTLGSSATFSCYVYDSAGHESTRPLSYEWEAAPYIVQEQRYRFTDNKHNLEIYNVKISDNNTSVWCRVDPSDNSGPSNKAKARIVVLPSLPGNTGVAIPTSQPMTTDEMLSMPMQRRGGLAAGATVASLLIVLIAFAVLLVVAYRKMRNTRRTTNLGIGSKLLGGSKSGPRKSKITRYSGGEDGYQEPVIPALNNPPHYTCLTHTNPINKRPIPPPRTKRGRRNTEPAQLGAIAEEEHSYNVIRPSSAEPQKTVSDQAGYIDMSGKNGKRQNRTQRRAYSQYDQDDDTDYENINIRTISNRNPTQVYVNQKVADRNRGHLPSHISGNYNSNKPRGTGTGGSLVYASLDLGESSGGEVFMPPEVERTTYAKILRILSVFRTMRSTRIRVIHTGADGKHASGQCQTTRYR